MINPALLSYVAVMSVTPGPNNLLLATSGVNFGFKRTLPMSLGISLGAGFQCFITMQALGAMVSWLGQMRLFLALAGCMYLLWLSWKILQSSAPEAKKDARPFGFLQMAAFQWINPKAWIMAINTALLFGTVDSDQALSHNLQVSLLYIVTNFPCILLWALLGDRLRQLLQSPNYLRVFNTAMALIMGVTALWLAGEELYIAYYAVEL
jgi:threonine/homoserine/homoserine lactone efflux protein